jgi:hypothetical protein
MKGFQTRRKKSNTWCVSIPTDILEIYLEIRQLHGARVRARRKKLPSR